MSYKVGVNLVEGQSISPISGVSTAISGIIGNFAKGPINIPTLVTSMGQFEKIFGTGPALGTTAYYSVKAFFAKVGSGILWVIRIASSSAAKSSYTFDDRQGTPADTLKIEWKYANSDGDNGSIKILDDSILSTTPAVTIAASATEATLNSVEGLEIGSDIKFYNGTNTEYKRLTNVDASSKKIYWSGGLSNSYTTVNGVITSMEFMIEVYYRGVLVESWPNLSMNDSVTLFVESQIAEKSDYISVTDLKSVDTDYTDMPAVVSTAQPLTGGNDGLSDVTGSDYSGVQSSKTGVYAFDNVPGLFRFCCPNPKLTDVDAAAAYQALVQSFIDYAANRVTLTFIADVPYGKTPTTAVTWGNNFVSRNSNFWYPWLKVYESNLEKYLPPSSFVMGCSVEKDFRRGIHKNVGNEAIPYAIDLEYNVSRDEGEVLNDANINTIRKFSGAGIRTYGGRSKSAVTQFRFIHFSELWNYIGSSLEEGTRHIPFEPNLENTWKQVERIVDAFLANEQRKGALFDASNPGSKAYVIKIDSSNNPTDQVALGLALLEIEYVPTGTIEKFIIKLTGSPAGLQLANK